jgi:hypothetical protein
VCRGGIRDKASADASLARAKKPAAGAGRYAARKANFPRSADGKHLHVPAISLKIR